jgi:hypothetical protein
MALSNTVDMKSGRATGNLSGRARHVQPLAHACVHGPVLDERPGEPQLTLDHAGDALLRELCRRVAAHLWSRKAATTTPPAWGTLPFVLGPRSCADARQPGACQAPPHEQEFGVERRGVLGAHGAVAVAQGPV